MKNPPTHFATNGIRTQSEVAEIMTQRGYPMTRQRVDQIEKKALKKLSRDPFLAKFAVEFGLVPAEDLED